MIDFTIATLSLLPVFEVRGGEVADRCFYNMFTRSETIAAHEHVRSVQVFHWDPFL